MIANHPPSNDLVTLLQRGTSARLQAVAARAADTDTPEPAPAHARPRGPGAGRYASRLGTVAGFGLAAKLGLGASVVAAGVVGAGAAGVLPAPADHAVRHAIEVVTPVQFTSPDDGTTSFGDRVSDDATGRSDGVKGVDGQTISSEAPGARHRPDGSAAPDQPPGRTGETGSTRANQTAAAPHVPDSVPLAQPSTDVPLARSDAAGQGQGHGPVSSLPDRGAPHVAAGD